MNSLNAKTAGDRMFSKASPVLDRSTYNRDAMEIGVVHLGVGAFHRAHQAPYFDALMETTGELQWAVAGINLRHAQSENIKRLRARDGEYVLKTVPSEGNASFRLIRSHKRLLDWTTEIEEAEEIVARQSVQAMTITVTESGYCLGEDSELDLSNPEIQAEIAGTAATTVYAYLRGSLTRRMRAAAGSLTILCCDNIRENGLFLQRNLMAYLDTVGDNALSEWIVEHVSFPCSMVDRITPQPERANSDEVAELFGIHGDFTVHAESFAQWVIEDSFRGVKPNLNAAGVQFVRNVDGYEQPKIRILNGGHTSLVYLGVLHGHETFDSALSDPELAKFFHDFIYQEVIPSLGDNVAVDLQAYSKSIKSRLLNRRIADSIGRIAMDGASKFPIFIVPTVRGCFGRGIAPTHALRSIASWYVFMRHVRTGTISFDYLEPKWAIVDGCLADGKEKAFARHSELWGDTPDMHPQFVDGILNEIDSLMARFPIG